MTKFEAERAAIALALAEAGPLVDKPKGKPGGRPPFQPGNQLWRLAPRCRHCNRIAVRNAAVCVAHGGANILLARGKRHPGTAVLSKLRRMERDGKLPQELLDHPAYRAMERRTTRRAAHTKARLVLGYLDMMDTGDARAWTEALNDADGFTGWRSDPERAFNRRGPNRHRYARNGAAVAA